MKNGGKKKCCVYNFVQCIYMLLFCCLFILCKCMDLFCMLELDELTGTRGTHPERNERVRLTFTFTHTKHLSFRHRTFKPDALIKNESLF